MEHIQGAINFNPKEISEDEREYASNSYLMSLFALFVGLPLPIFNLIATIIFYLGNRKRPKFVKWHCTQALISQFAIFFFNSAAFWWTISIIFNHKEVTNYYISYIILVLVLNTIEIISTIYTSIETRKGIHIRWFFFSDLTDKIIEK